MIHESDKVNQIVITESNINFETIHSKQYYPKEYDSEVKKANLLLLPYEGFNASTRNVFPEETMQFYKHIKEFDDNNLISEICISDEEYSELELHADVVSIANMIIEIAILPIAVGLITNYLDRKIQRRKTDLKIKVNMIVVDGEKSKSISYEGDADKFEQTIKAAENQLK
ncbi:hypothetical protein P9654_12150 [Bacillus atrophaeus]|uniref:hypothetical protein n=1 Tax=Bacillus atrophaeus TaxID=1452 RepID=UPI002E1B4839|nr:hypothetical protein [Bacillus atrophaeus]MED4820592.1 hypothetical protein [Bacillus atrophaeus]